MATLWYAAQNLVGIIYRIQDFIGCKKFPVLHCTCKLCQREHFYTRAPTHTCLLTFSPIHMWKCIAVACGRVTYRSGHMWLDFNFFIFSRIYWHSTMCVFSTSVTFLLLRFHNVHLVRRPSVSQARRKTPPQRWLYRLSLCRFDETGPPRSRRQRVIPLAPAFFPKGQISLRNKAKRAAWKTYHCSQSCS